MEYTVPETTLECLQGILQELVRAREPSVIFTWPEAPPEPAVVPTTIGTP